MDRHMPSKIVARQKQCSLKVFLFDILGMWWRAVVLQLFNQFSNLFIPGIMVHYIRNIKT